MSAPKRHLDRSTRFCTMHLSDQHTDRHTNHATCEICHASMLRMRCCLIIIIIIIIVAATTFHSVIIIFWKETAFPRWRAMDRRWKRNSVSLVSSVTTVMRLPISCFTYGCLMPRTCCFYGKRTEDVGAGQPGVLVIIITKNNAQTKTFTFIWLHKQLYFVISC